MRNAPKKKPLILPFRLLVIVLFLALLIVGLFVRAAEAKAPTLQNRAEMPPLGPVSVTVVPQVESPVDARFTPNPVILAGNLPLELLKIARCESGGITGRQFDDEGKLVIGQYTPDVGKFQISWTHHSTTIQKMNIDIYTEEGNTAFALYLYRKNGTRDWNASRKCWSNDNP